MKKLLLTRTRQGLGNQYLYAYSKAIVNDAEELGWVVNNLMDEKNNQKEIRSRLEKNDYNFVVFNGHGDDNSICGYNNECLIDVKSAHLLGKTVVFARTCSSVNCLGKEAVIGDCVAFIGYNSEFYIPHINEFEATPLNDPTAKPVLDVSNTVAQHFLKGCSVIAAVTAARNKAAKLMLKMLTSEEPYDGAAFRALFHNHSSLAFEGSPDASC